MVAAEASHPEAMYLYGMILINQGRYSEGSNYLKQLWKKKGFQAVRRCLVNCKPVLLKLSVRDYILLMIICSPIWKSEMIALLENMMMSVSTALSTRRYSVSLTTCTMSKSS
uniref:Uncharacterized protein n=1 Tax=Noccaea caerulescens TaxID=107243 RepID=A0A1J3JMB8_NOCCA